MASMRTDMAFALKNIKANRYMDIPGTKGDTQTQGALVQLWGMDYNPDRYVQFKKALEGYYYVQHMHNKTVWTMAGRKDTNGTKLQLWSNESGKYQQFKFIYAGSAMTFKIQDRNSNKFIDASDSQIAKNGCPVQLWSSHHGDNQKWKLEPAGLQWFAPEQPVRVKVKVAYSNKYWDIDGDGNSGKVKGKRLQIWDMDGGADRYYTIKRSGEHAWIWIEMDGGKRIDVLGGKTNVNRTGLHTWDAHNGHAQKFAIHPTGKYTCIILSKGWKALDVESGKINDNGPPIHIWDLHYGASQQFQFIDAKTGKLIDFSKF